WSSRAKELADLLAHWLPVITDVRKAAGALLARPDAPTAIITNSDYTALGIYKTARDLSLRIGPDVSIIGHDDLPTSELLGPPLATILPSCQPALPDRRVFSARRRLPPDWREPGHLLQITQVHVVTDVAAGRVIGRGEIPRGL